MSIKINELYVLAQTPTIRLTLRYLEPKREDLNEGATASVSPRLGLVDGSDGMPLLDRMSRSDSSVGMNSTSSGCAAIGFGSLLCGSSGCECSWW